MSPRSDLQKVNAFQNDSQANLNIKERYIITLPIDINPKDQQLKQLTHQVLDHLVNYVEGQVKRIEALVPSRLPPTTPSPKDVPATAIGT